MKKTLLLFTAVVLGASFQAQAVTVGNYTALRAGFAATKHQTKEQYSGNLKPVKIDWNGDAGMGSIAFGLKAGYLRAEVEGNATSTTKETRQFNTENYSDVTNTTSRINTSSVMFNTYLELPVDFPLRPYVSAGAGIGHIKGKFKSRSGEHKDQVTTTSVSGNHFAWQVGAGLAYEISRDWSVDLGYRFMNLGHVNKNIKDYSETGALELGKIRLDAKIYNVYFGVRCAF